MSVEAVLTALGALQVLQLVNQLVLIRGLRSVRQTLRPPGPLLDPGLVQDLKEVAEIVNAVRRKGSGDGGEAATMAKRG